MFKQCEQLRYDISNEKYLTTETAPTDMSVSEEQFKEATDLVRDPLVAVRARGMIQLRELVLARDTYVLTQLTDIVAMSVKNLKDEDE